MNTIDRLNRLDFGDKDPTSLESRSVRRRREREEKKKTVTYNFTKEQLDAYVLKEVDKIRDDIQEEIRADSEKSVFEMLIGIPVLVLHDHFGFGRSRATKFIEHVLNQVDAVDGGYYNLQDLRQTIFEETGVSLEDGVINIKTRADVNKIIKESRDNEL